MLLPLFPRQKGTVLQSPFIVLLISRHFTFLTLNKMSFRKVSAVVFSSWNVTTTAWLAS